MIAIKRVDRLLAREVIAAIAVTLVLLVALDAFSALARELDEFNQGDYGFGTAALFIALTLPRRAYEFFPFAAVIGALVGLGGLAASAELTALRAAGMSKLRIAFGTLGAVLAATLAVMAIGEFIAPHGDQRGEALVAGAKDQELIRTGRSGIWAREGATLLNAKRGQIVDGSVELYAVRLFEFTADGKLLRITAAARATHAPGRWDLDEVVRQTFTPTSVTTEPLAALAWPSTLEPDLIASTIVSPRYLGIAALSDAITFMRANEIDPSAYEAAMWQRVFFPLSVLVLVFAVVPFAFGALRSGGLGKRILIGMMLAIAWHFVEQAIFNLSTVYGFDASLGQALPALVLGAGALVYYLRSR